MIYSNIQQYAVMCCNIQRELDDDSDCRCSLKANTVY